MKIKWPEKLPEDPIEAAKIILSNSVEGKGLDFILKRINIGAKKPISPQLFKKVRAYNLETRKVLFLQKKYGIRLAPIALVLPEDAFKQIADAHHSSCNGIYFEKAAGIPEVTPFDKTGFSILRAALSQKETLITAWHEIRHHIYESRSKRAISPLDRLLLTELFAHAVNVRAKSETWPDVGKKLRMQIRPYSDPKIPNEFFLSDLTGWYLAITEATTLLEILSRYCPQSLFDGMIVNSKSITLLIMKLKQLEQRVRIGKSGKQK